ncbi:MAG: 16S rRNA (uracil(1498)-N(3))-methyltransferase [Gammaproteobacteria bacterium]|nr:16S rRNA (uracil(1498)-N(3))-methyltransferase [Gammaproteobacteria bacterium]
MRIPRVYIEKDLTVGNTLQLDKAASSYLIKVLRLPVAAEIILFNGQGGSYKASLLDHSKQAQVQLDEFVPGDNESPLKITLIQGISKGDHMDITIQKAVELGVSELIPLICERTVVNLKGDRLEKKMRHWQGIANSACEQSGRNKLLQIHPPKKLSVLSLSESEAGFILQPTAGQNLLTQSAVQSVSIIIGPEGGFTDEEIETSVGKGFREVRFGPRVLRTETAAIAAISIIQSSWGDLN